jgi:hypothetical protein
MYTNPKSGQVIAGTAAAQLSAYRRTLIELLGEAKVITLEEYELATSRILATQSLATLQKWYRNCIREIARREEAAAMAPPVEYATAEQQQEVQCLANSVYITRGEKTQALLKAPRLDQVGIIGLTGELWAKILARTGQCPGPEVDLSLALTA